MTEIVKPRPPVRRLDPRVVAQIAAGEMIQRPFSVVKELVENSLDAGATSIEVELGDTPDQMLQVSDDGWGMGEEDLLLALEAHATSKLAQEEDLLQVASLGFRGEAVPSIGRVSRMSIVTFDGLAASGCRVLVDGGERRRLEPAARTRGTTVRVEDLFFNSPVRKRFLKGPEGEVKLVVKLIATYAVAFPAVAFRLRHRGEPLLQLGATDTLAARISQIHGPLFLDKCLFVESDSSRVQIQGYVGVPELARPGTQHQTLLVNQRWVSAPWFSASLRQGFGDLIAPQRNPFALILLTLPPSRVDVNVHPTKREVRFLDESALFGELMHAVRAQTSRLIPAWNLDPNDRGSGQTPEQAGLDGFGAGRPAPYRGTILPSQPVLDALYGAPRGSAGPAGVADATRREATGEAAPTGAGHLNGVSAEALSPGSTSEVAIPGSNTEAAVIGSAVEATASGSTGGPAESSGALPYPGLVPLWQLHQRYLFAQTRQGLLIIDQHAAHERVLYERALANLRGSPATTQELLFPLAIQLEPEEWDAWREIAEEAINLGVDAEEFGRQAVLLRGVPVIWDQDPEGRFRELLMELGSRRGRGLQRLERLAASFACRSAVRSGQTLSLEEMNALVDQLFATSQPHGDPHGRPTFIQVALGDLDRRFGRSGGGGRTPHDS